MANETPSYDELLSKLDDIDNTGVGLTDWEIEFVDSMLKVRGGFSTDQAQKIVQIYEDRVS